MKTKQVIIETAGGSNLKYHYDEKNKLFILKKILPAGMTFPYDFGFFPGTRGEDGDPLDVLVISEFRAFPGCMMDCRLIGGFKAEQTEKGLLQKRVRNDRFFVIPVLSVVYQSIRELKDLPENMMEEIEQFFVQYNKIEKKKFSVLKKLNAGEANKIVQSRA